MNLFISPNFGTKSDSVKLIEAARKRGIHTSTLLNTWDTEKEKVFEYKKPSEEPSALYGEHAFCEFLAQEMHWNLYSNSLDWITKLPKEFVRRDVRYMTISEAIDLENESHSILGKQYIEPADDYCFHSGIYEKFPSVPLDTPILVHSHVEWTTKFRFIIVNGKIETYCCYKVANVFNEPSIHGMSFTGNGTTAVSFISTLLNHFNTAPACVIDIGFIQRGSVIDSGWAVCGTYPVWSSELYGCDPDKFLKALFVSCEPGD